VDTSDLREQLLRLYLRLNGFFTSGFIDHSPEPRKNTTEVDTLAVRFPYNAEPERRVKVDPWLDLSQEHIEFAICEAKTQVRFNRALYSNAKAIERLLRRAGMFPEHDVVRLAPEIQKILVPESHPESKIRRTGPHHGIVIRTLLFCMNYQRPRCNHPWFVGWDSAFGFIFRCLSPHFEPRSCGRRYGAGQWAEFETLVAFFKSWPGKTPPKYEDCEKALMQQASKS